MRQVVLKSTIVAATLSLGAIAFPAGAQTPGAPDNASKGPATGPATTARSVLSSSDRKFVEKASQGGLAEVQMGKLASQKAQSADVKQFGEKMAADHAAANGKLAQVASEKGLAMANDMDSSSKREYDKLAKLSGAQFDREYMKTMVSDHQKDVKEFQSEAKSAKDSEVKNFAQSTLPTLEEHLKLAKSAQASALAEKAASKK